MIHLDADAYLIREGDLPTCGFLIERGSLEVVLERPQGDRVLAVLGAGEIVGEMALVDRAPRTASVRAREDCWLLPITADHITKRFAAADPVLQLVLGTVLDRFRATLNDIGGTGTAQPVASKNLRVTTAALAELRLEKELEIALRDNQITVYYQPIVRLADGHLVGFEALARWTHPTRGLIPPSTFVPIAEASGLSGELAKICLRQVTRALPALQARAAANASHVDTPRISVNISGSDLTLPNFVRDLNAIVAESGQCMDALTLELTETALVHSPSEAATALDAMRHLGFTIAVDDFGTGYSSLNYIRTLPVDVLKIDRSFVEGMSYCSTTRSIVASMLQLAGSLGLKVVGEGVETPAQHASLHELGCQLGQGYLFGHPLPLNETLALVAKWQAASPAAICDPSK